MGLNDTTEAVEAMRAHMSDVDAKTRQLTPLENELLDIMAQCVAQGNQDCCFSRDVAQNKMIPVILHYRPDTDFETYER